MKSLALFAVLLLVSVLSFFAVFGVDQGPGKPGDASIRLSLGVDRGIVQFTRTDYFAGGAYGLRRFGWWYWTWKDPFRNSAAPNAIGFGWQKSQYAWLDRLDVFIPIWPALVLLSPFALGYYFERRARRRGFPVVGVRSGDEVAKPTELRS